MAFRFNERSYVDRDLLSLGVRRYNNGEGANSRMGTQRQKTNPTEAKTSPVNLLLVGVFCLAIGIGIGYYFGLQSVPAPSATKAQAGTPAANPSTFLQDEANLKTFLQTNPKDLNALVQLGNLYYDNGQFGDAVIWYGKALEIDPNNPNVRTDRGTSYWRLGQADSAIAEFQKSLQVDPSHAQTLYNLGVVYVNGKNDPAQARKVWEKLLATNPNYPDRAKLQEQIASLSPGSATSPPPGTSRGTSAGMEDLLQRMKTKK